jgi:Ca2+/Na+ antiporter
MWGIILMFTFLITAFFAVGYFSHSVGLYYWGFFLLSLFALLGVWEVITVRKTGKTLSEHYTNLTRDKKLLGAILTTIFVAAFGYLIYHLLTGF